MTKDQLNELLNRACEIITSLEGYAEEAITEYQGSVTQKNVDAFFNEVDMLNDPNWLFPGAPLHDTPENEETSYENYVNTVKSNIDVAVEEGILRESDDYNYLSKESFVERIRTDKDFANQWGDLEAQDYDTFGDNKI